MSCKTEVKMKFVSEILLIFLPSSKGDEQSKKKSIPLKEIYIYMEIPDSWKTSYFQHFVRMR